MAKNITLTLSLSCRTRAPLEAGAVAPWSGAGGKTAGTWYLSKLQGLATHYGFSISSQYKKLPARVQDILLNGSGDEEISFAHEGGKSRYSYTEPFEGVIGNLERRYRETASEDVREDLERFMDSQPCPTCAGLRLKKRRCQ